jgi:hypothetical protein
LRARFLELGFRRDGRLWAINRPKIGKKRKRRNRKGEEQEEAAAAPSSELVFSFAPIAKVGDINDEMSTAIYIETN